MNRWMDKRTSDLGFFRKLETFLIYKFRTYACECIINNTLQHVYPPYSCIFNVIEVVKKKVNIGTLNVGTIMIIVTILNRKSNIINWWFMKTWTDSALTHCKSFMNLAIMTVNKSYRSCNLPKMVWFIQKW